jgi:outer membrane biosynthesis protein TonB
MPSAGLALQTSRRELALGDETRTNPAHRRYAAISCVAAIHIAAFGAFTAVVPTIMRTPGTQELQLSIFNPALPPSGAPPPPLSRTFRLPDTLELPEPQLDIAPGAGTGAGLQANETTERLAPILDPSHRNERPELPGSFGAIFASMSMKLRLLLLPDSSVLDAVIVKSTGEAEIDKMAADWVKASWRNLPAIVNGKPIESWVTVIVRFAPIH